MSPSSLIFVAVIVIWAFYLVVHVARRREHMATARSVDRFSAQMRVLERRAVRLDPPAPSSVRVSSASMARRRPLVAQATTEQVFAGAVSEKPVLQASVLADPSGREAAEKAAAVTADFFVDEPRRQRSWTARIQRPEVGGRLARGIRGAALLSAVAVLLVVAVLALVGVVPAWTLLAPAALLVAVMCWLRAAVRAQSAKRRREAAAMHRRRERAAMAAREEALEARPSAAAMPVAQELVAPREDVVPERQPAEIAAPEAGSARRLDPFEIAAQAHDALSVKPQAQKVVDPLLEDRAWSPTPVPPPTYTLKARADRPMPAPLNVPVPIEIDEDDIAWDDQRQQPRVVSA